MGRTFYLGAALAGAAGLLVARTRSAETLRRYRTARLRALLHHAYATVPYYRRRFEEAGFHPNQFRTLDDLQRIPITKKNDLRLAEEPDVIAKDCDAKRLIRYGTGGTTGAPTVVRFTRFEDRLLRVMRIQVLRGFGLRWRDRRSAIVFSPGSRRSGWLQHLGILRSRSIHAYAPWEQIRTELRNSKPDVLRGLPSALSSLADVLTEEDRSCIRPRFITTDSENLTTLARTRIEERFAVRVFDVYDCFECNVIAYQCPKTAHYHVLDTSVIAEVLRNGEPALPGETGEIAFTSLHTWAAPLIRYMPGDLVEQGAPLCACGAPNACLGKVHGRAQDRFCLPDGRSIHPGIFAVWLYPLCAFLRRYQIIQQKQDRVLIKLQVVPGRQIPAETLRVAREGMARDLGERVVLNIEMVDDIPSEPNGKFRPYRSEVEASSGSQIA